MNLIIVGSKTGGDWEMEGMETTATQKKKEERVNLTKPTIAAKDSENTK